MLLATPVVAGAPEVVSVVIDPLGGERFRVSVTIRHGDTGWDHYANGWKVVDAKGTVLGDRVLAHPHVDEQPFTRSLTLEIPDEIERVRVVARDSAHGDAVPSGWVELKR